jgi:SpoVK/Ycf46/Vps4 family AAA+-type ATPase
VRTHSRGSKPAHRREPQRNDARRHVDLVRGKGEGIIMLLHGPPGVGKTSTAECVAELCNRPLFQITCGDIGIEPRDVEKNLDDNFRLAHRWGCVLLLDEADVFLTERGGENLKRNSLVSGVCSSDAAAAMSRYTQFS